MTNALRRSRGPRRTARPLAPLGFCALAVFFTAIAACSTMQDVRASFDRPPSDGSTPAPTPVAAPRAQAPAATSPPAEEKFPREGPEMRVRLARGADTARIAAEGSIVATTPAAHGLVTELGGPFTLTRRGASFILTASDVERTIVAPAIELRPAHADTIRLDGAAHLGAFLCLPRPDISDKAFDVVELVALEQYLPGVVAAELFPNWSPAAYEAQAIAARSYALHERARRRAAGDAFDVENTVTDQAYNGAASTSAARRAVERTRGEVLMWQGEVLRAYYSSACGGRPGSARDTWPTTAGYEYNLSAPLQAAPREYACHASSNYSWVVTRSRADLTARLAAWGAENGKPIKDIKSIASLRVARRNAAERPAEFEITDTTGRTFRIQADSFRHAANTATRTLPAPDAAHRLRSGDVEPIVEGDAVIISGRGFGHGVGLCQFCTEGFALRGMSAERILTIFYPGTGVTQLY